MNVLPIEIINDAALGAARATRLRQFEVPIAVDLKLVGTGSITVQFQTSQDGINWDNVGAALSADGQISVTNPALFVRANTTAFVAPMKANSRATAARD